MDAKAAARVDARDLTVERSGMLKRVMFVVGVMGGALLVVQGCGSDDSSGTGGAGGTSGSSGTAGTGASGGSAGSGGTAGSAGSAGAGGTAGTGGAAGGSGAAGSGGTAGSSGAAGTDGGGGSAGAGGVTAGHLLVSEVGLEPGAAEFIEILNPTSAEVDLTDYYLSDNSAYYQVASGPWSPQGTAQTDFLARFPSGTKIAAGAVLTIAADPGFETTYGKCPDLIMNSTGTSIACGSSSVPAMTIPANGSVGSASGSLISNDREMIVLFTWDGSSAIVKDVDYVTWLANGASFDNNTRIDKTAVTGYLADTARGSQKPAVPSPAADGGVVVAIQRCAGEIGETATGGNGITGHDETSEDLGASFKSGVASPGVVNPCP